MRVKKLLSILFLVLMFTSMSANAVELNCVEYNQIQPRYIGVKVVVADIAINSNGRANAYGRALIDADYTADVTVSLFQDGSSIKSWKSSGDGIIEIDKTYYVTSGHDYYVAVSVIVYNANGNLVDSILLESNTKHY